MNMSIQKAMLAIQQGKLALQQGQKYVDLEQFRQVEEQLIQAKIAINEAKLKGSGSEGQFLEEANMSIEDTLHRLQRLNHPPNLQQG
ncbi:hypothetical protein BKP45_14590 [Anaerobacillus alkalidiazotrophicus]|uniref:DUF2524 domain-containing protein n=1 Tax=Anaerobacillus alkalidiazotrophicus TaxID=472963 RepID=A0A1S2M2H7_9BACI|nr:hypothetical protein [Anaerobacillus alkalidiazotrophicus]OIJ18952.1 hypothetical protein BKP45_14590 [Anaerobacillus alkalidiazotrophicus]